MHYLASMDQLLTLTVFFKEQSQERETPSSQDFSLMILLELLTAHLQLFQHSKNKITKVLLGVAVYQLEVLQNSFNYLSQDTIAKSRLLNQKLNITDSNRLLNDERIYYLTQSYEYIETYILDEKIQQLKNTQPLFKWHNKNELLADMREMRKSLLSQKQFTKQMLTITHATPELLAIQQRMYEFLLTYHPQQNSLGRMGWINHDNPVRVKQINLFRTLHQSCSFYFINSPYDESINHDFLQESESLMRKGLLTFMAMDIKKGSWNPGGGLFNAGSVLFKGSLAMLNNLSSHDYNERMDWLRALGKHLANLKNEPQYYQEIIEEWTVCGKLNFEKELDIFQNKINAYIDELEIKKHQPSLPKWMIAQVAEKGTRYFLSDGIKKAIDWGAKRFIQAGITTFAAQVGGPVGVMIFVAGNVVSYVLTQPLTKDMISSTITTTISGSLLSRMSKTIGEKTADVITNFFTPTKEEFAVLRENMSQADEKVFCRLINTLLKLPDDEVSQAEKNHIKMAFPINDGKLQPLAKSETPLITHRMHYV